MSSFPVIQWELTLPDASACPVGYELPDRSHRVVEFEGTRQWARRVAPGEYVLVKAVHMIEIRGTIVV